MVPVGSAMASLCERSFVKWPSPQIRKNVKAGTKPEGISVVGETLFLRCEGGQTIFLPFFLQTPSNGIDWFLLSVAHQWQRIWTSIEFLGEP
jgi:hypothetical protein